MHFRQKIREEVKSLLKNKTKPGTSVYAGRKRIISDEKLPAIVIYTDSESNEEWNKSLEYQRSLELIIEVQVKGSVTECVDNDLDDYAQLIEEIIIPSQTLNNLVNKVVMNSQDITISDESSSYILGRLRIEFLVEYFVRYQASGVTDFEQLNTTYNSDNEDEENKPNDVINLPQE